MCVFGLTRISDGQADDKLLIKRLGSMLADLVARFLRRMRPYLINFLESERI